MSPESFPLRGVVGVGTSETNLDMLPARALESLDGIELRADLFPSLEAALERLADWSRRYPVLFTCRLTRQGGRWEEDDEQRLDGLRAALRQGASAVDVEWGSRAAQQLAAEGAAIIVSHHDFEGMPDAAQLEEWTSSMEALEPRAVKIVPTARTLEDASRMLDWVGDARPSGPRRIGFAMGEKGIVSRVLSVARGAPYTYGALETTVAPGQTSVVDLARLYRIHALGRATELLAVVGNPVGHSRSPRLHNPELAALGIDAVYVPILLDSLDEVTERCRATLRLRGLSVTIPFKEDAFRLADRSDDRSRACGATNTLVFEPDGSVAGYNTDFDGVLGPLRRVLGELDGVSVAVLGNGGAARGAIEALKEAGARPTLHFRNPARGLPVAEELAVPAAPLSSVRRGSFRVILNATSLGLRAGDPSPVAADVFDALTVAFDMVYEPARTAFLRDAEAAGATCILGQEMLVAQGRVQFELFTGRAPSTERFGRDAFGPGGGSPRSDPR